MKRTGLVLRSAGAFMVCALLAMTCASAAEDPSEVQPLDGGWREQYLGSDPQVPFFPDGNANYWVYRFDRGDSGSRVGIRLEGLVPDVRYMSVTVYDDTRFAAVAHLRDTDIANSLSGGAALTGSLAGADPQGTYSIDIVPAGTRTPAAGNLIEYDPALRRVSVYLRYYLPQGDATGGVPLPTLSAFDLDTGEPVPLPQVTDGLLARDRALELVKRLVTGILDRRLGQLFSADGPGPILFSFRTDVQRFYANPDNHYLAIPVVKGADQVAIVRFLPPTTPLTAPEGEADVRYWSLSLGDLQSYNVYTLADYQAKVAPDGYVYVVLGDPAPDIVAEAEARGFNFIPWTLADRGVLIYRNMLAAENFRGNFERVPGFSAAGKWRRQIAQRFIGSYAPGGALLDLVGFLGIE